jgi:hypothetical protein
LVPAKVTGSCSTGAETLGAIFTACSGAHLVVSMLKMVTVGFLVLPFLRPIGAADGHANLRKLIDQMLDCDGNDTPAISAVLIALGLGLIVRNVPYTGMTNYLVNLTFRGSMGALMGMAFGTLLVVVFCRIRSWQGFMDQFAATQVNAVGWWFGGGFVIAAIIM